MRILFVCTGNTCRSPLAEVLARQVAIERGLGEVEISSAGTSAWDGAPASDGALLVGIERNLDLGGHRARTLTSELVRSVDLILAMGPHHLERIQALGGDGTSAYLLSDYATRGESKRPISDPIGAELDVYRATANELDAAIHQVFDRIQQDGRERSGTT